MTEEQVLQLFKCLADRSRLGILRALLQEEMYVERLAQRLALTPATISFHLKKLEEAGLVTSRHDQYYTMYALAGDQMTQPVAALIAGADDQAPVEAQREQQYRQKVLDSFLEYGRLKAIPAQRKKERIVLEELVKAFAPGRDYPEQEVNDILSAFHEDYCTLRRDMIGEGLLEREKGVYRRRG